MAPLPTPGAVIRATFRVTDGGSIDAGSRIYLRYSGGPPNGTDLNALATSIAAAYNTNLVGWLRSGEALTSIDCLDLSSETGSEGTWSGSNGGTLTGDPLPSSACVVINHKIGRHYRGGKPRTYARLGTTSELQGTNEWTTAFQADVLTGWEAFVAAVLATTGMSITVGNIANVSYYKGFTVFTTPGGRARNIPTPRSVPVVDDITLSAIAVKVGSQRRRLNI